MITKDQIFSWCNKLTEDCNKTLISINGSSNLPPCLEREVNAPLSTISADTLQGIKIGLSYLKRKIEEEDAT